jgi:hypothetical protein
VGAMLAAIGRELRVALADVVAEGLPERLAVLLSKLNDPSNEDQPATPPQNGPQ